MAGLISWRTCYQHSEVEFVFIQNPWNAECIKMRAKFGPIYSVEVPPPQKTLQPDTKVSDMDPCRDRYSREKICVLVTLGTKFLAPDEGTEKSRAKGAVL
jgi:hypothetical protein